MVFLSKTMGCLKVFCQSISLHPTLLPKDLAASTSRMMIALAKSCYAGWPGGGGWLSSDPVVVLGFFVSRYFEKIVS